MDFSRVELSDEDQAFYDEARSFLATHMTEEVRRRDRETGDNFDEGLHLEFGAAGYLAGEWKPASEGGFTRVRRRIWEQEKRRVHVPWVTWGTTAMVARSVAKFGSPALQDEVMPGVFSGHIRLCLGYTEPEGGSDVATCKTRAVREADGSSWVINGSKMFTTGAHNCQYVFLITNTDPDAPKHKSLTMFLVPLNSPGIDIQGIRTVDGDRTNIVYYSDVRVDDKYRLGPVNAGWTVLREPLNRLDARIDYAFELCLARKPTLAEREKIRAYFDTQSGILNNEPEAVNRIFPASIESTDPAVAAQWTTFGRALLNLNEFITRE